MHTPLFETERLVVRHFCPDDLDVFAALIADPVVMRYIGEGITLSREDTAYWIGVCQKKYADRGYGTSAVFHKDGSFLGYCGVVRAPDRDFDELTYTLHRHAWGQGYATEVAGAMLAYVFERASLDHIYATVYPDNVASLRVLEKLGANFQRQEVEEDGTRVNHYIFSRPSLSEHNDSNI